MVSAIERIPHTTVPGEDYTHHEAQDDQGRDMESEFAIGTLTRLHEVDSASSRRNVLKLIHQPTRILRAQSREAALTQMVWSRN